MFGCCAAFLAGCAQLPSQENTPRLKAVEQYQAQQTFAGAVKPWPQDSWWQSYGDAQLDTLIVEGLKESPSMAIAVARLRRAESVANVAGSALQPQVNAQASASDQKQSYNYLFPRAAVPQGWKDYGQATLDFSWELDFWGKNRAALAAAISMRQAAAADAAQAKLTLTASIAAAYGELARLYAAHDTARAAVTVRQKSLKLFQNRHQHGMESLLSVKQAQSRLASSEEELLTLDEQIALQRNRLAALIGVGPDRGLVIARPKLNVASGFGLPNTLQLELLGRRPDIVASRLRVESSEKSIEKQQAEFYPNVNLSAFIGLQSLGLNMLTKSGSDFGSVGPAISLPIFNGGRLRAQLAGAQAEHDEAIANYNQTVTQALQQVADAATSQKALGLQLKKMALAVDAARDAHRIVNNRYQGGLANYLEVLTAEETLLTALRAQSDLQSRSFTLDVALVKALGGGYRTPAHETKTEGKNHE